MTANQWTRHCLLTVGNELAYRFCPYGTKPLSFRGSFSGSGRLQEICCSGLTLSCSAVGVPSLIGDIFLLRSYLVKSDT